MPDSPAGIDPRGPRFAAGITTVLLVVATYLALTGVSPRLGQETASFGWFAYQPLADAVFVPGASPFAQRIADAGFVAVAIAAALFLWGVLSPRTAPWGVVFRRLVRPRLAPPTELEDPRPPRFAQGVGLFVTVVGLILHAAGVPWALVVAAAAALIAAFLNATFGLCLGCQLYLLLQRAGILGRSRTA
ncbi:DUF4395 domain-containing protein [Microbacterium paludicola]|uniref:DUF4395 domain-containing protein n=1 Tax=Microbacterium paludicola TaxID=300019 RepID=A0A4Y9FVV8_9MICO|nr:DUF4395 domain-containing protein [Microbacterium paludicola]MBF0815815.1 DUF4395 domain-containing protein [Microbacterium paludicola]TFU33459.1 DUF4395 domain-containing protein [Microbacterium paludicola]